MKNSKKILDASLVVIVSQRRKQLQNLLAGVARCIAQPLETIIVYMDDAPPVTFENLNIREIRLGKTSPRLPLAEARNNGARHCSASNIIFLDVDCIPDKYFFNRIVSDHRTGTVTMGSPRYLEQAADLSTDLFQSSVKHPHLDYPRDRKPEQDYNQFWSLCFAIDRYTFYKTEGFYEDYIGYGAEDTDFGQKLKKYDIALYRSPATVFHQFHPKYTPPLNHFEDIVRNSETFNKRWGFLPMMKWLEDFEDKGLISIEDNEKIKIQRTPTDAEIEECLSTRPY